MGAKDLYFQQDYDCFLVGRKLADDAKQAVGRLPVLRLGARATEQRNSTDELADPKKAADKAPSFCCL